MARQGRNVERFERLARELAQGVSINDAMLAAGYSATSAKRGVIRHYSDWISPTAHPVVAAKPLSANLTETPAPLELL